jgi:hypothetical protein
MHVRRLNELGFKESLLLFDRCYPSEKFIRPFAQKRISLCKCWSVEASYNLLKSDQSSDPHIATDANEMLAQAGTDKN